MSKVVCTKKSITHPEDWWDAFQARAKKKGMTLSEWMGACCLESLPKSVRKTLSDRPPANRPRKYKKV